MIEATKATSAFVPANNDEANGEILGRCNAMHDWMMLHAEDNYFSSDCKTVCVLMGFTDVIRHHIQYVEELKAAEKAEKEKAESVVQP